jgi:hypothetical protein
MLDIMSVLEKALAFEKLAALQNEEVLMRFLLIWENRIKRQRIVFMICLKMWIQ